MDGSNYIVPVDGALKDETDVAFEAVRLDVVLTQLERQPRTNLVFLDACRDNPLAGGPGTTRSPAGQDSFLDATGPRFCRETKRTCLSVTGWPGQDMEM